MNFVENITITHTKLDYLINSTNTFKELGLLFLGEVSSKEYVIIDVLNFGFLFFFPIISNFLNIDVAILISYFFLIIFFASIILTLISIYKICINKSKIIPLYLIIFFYYGVIYKYVLVSNAEYFIYFFWGILPLTYYLIHSYSYKVQISFILICSILIIILGSLVYYSFLSFLIFYFSTIYLDKKKIFNKILLIFPILSIVFLLSFQSYSNKEALNNLSKVNDKIFNGSKNQRNIGNNAYVAFYAGLGYLNSDYFDGYFHDNEIYKLVGKINKEGQIINLNVDNVTKLTEKDISLVREKIFYFILEKPIFIFKVIFAKIGVLLGYFLIVCNISVIYFFSSKFKLKFKLPLITNLIFSSVIPIISIPSKFYSLSFIGASISIFIISYCKNNKII